MKRLIALSLILSSCHYSKPQEEPLTFIQIQDRNGVVETITAPERLKTYEITDFFSSQPYKKVMRVYKKDGKNYSKLCSYHPNGTIHQYLEAESMRAKGIYREWFPNGELKIDAVVIGGTADLSDGAARDWLFDGVNRVFDESGRLLAEISYEKGYLQGSSIYYYSSGMKQRHIEFSQNLPEGPYVEYYPSGQLKCQALFAGGQKDSASRIYHENGILLAEEEYRSGLILEGKYYNTQGELVSEIEKGGGLRASFENGTLTLMEHKMGRAEGLVRQYTESNELKKVFYLKNNQKVGEETEFFVSGESLDAKDPIPKLSLYWQDQAVHGAVKTWYPSGKIESQREFVRNKRSGSSLAWYPNGELMLIEEYEDDLLTTGQYFPMHKKDPVSTVSNGSGIATLYDTSGALVRKVHYVKGKPSEP